MSRLLTGLLLLVAVPTFAQTSPVPNLTPISLNNRQLAQATPDLKVPSPTIIPTDVTPTGIDREQELVRPGYKFYLLQKLPARMWFNATTEVTQRLETNPLFTIHGGQTDYVFRVQPNVTLGYKLSPHLGVYCNYFVIKDLFARNRFLGQPTFQSLAIGLRQEIPIKTRTNLQFDLQVRELWQAVRLRQADMLPGVTITHVFTPRLVGFGNCQLQMRSRNIFQGPTREIDPFYTLGLLYRWGDVNFVFSDTLVTNFRNRNKAVPPNGNAAMIANFEVSRPITKKLPSLVGFIRAEQIYNWSSHRLPGLSGFDFRLFGGLRMSINKPSYYAQFEKLRHHLKESSDPAP